MRAKNIVFLMVVLAAFGFNKSYAGIGTFNSSVISGNNLQTPATGSTLFLNLKDDEYSYTSNAPTNTVFPFTNYKIKDFVSLQYTGAQGVVYTNPWTVTVTFNLFQYNSLGGYIGEIQNQSLTVKYDPNRLQTDEIYRSEFESDLGGDSISVQILTVSTTGMPPRVITPQDVEFSSRIVVDRYWTFDGTTNLYTAPQLKGTLSPA